MNTTKGIAWAAGLAADEDVAPDTRDVARGYRAGLMGRGELDTIRGPWASRASALIRASNFNYGVQQGRYALSRLSAQGVNHEP